MKIAWFIGSFSIELLGGIFLLHGRKDHLLLSAASGVVCSILLLFAWLTKKDGKIGVSRVTVSVAGFFVGIGLCYFPGVLFYRSQISATKRRLSPVFRSLDESRRDTWIIGLTSKLSRERECVRKISRASVTWRAEWACEQNGPSPARWH